MNRMTIKIGIIEAELTFKLIVETPDPQFNFDS